MNNFYSVDVLYAAAPYFLMITLCLGIFVWARQQTMNGIIIIVGGMLLAASPRLLDTSTYVEKPIHYCAEHGGIKLLDGGFLGLFRQYICKDDTVESDRGETESVRVDPKPTAN